MAPHTAPQVAFHGGRRIVRRERAATLGAFAALVALLVVAVAAQFTHGPGAPAAGLGAMAVKTGSARKKQARAAMDAPTATYQVLLEEARKAERRRDREGAQRAYRRAIEVQPSSSVDATAQVALARIERGRNRTAAVELYRDAMRRDPGHAHAALEAANLLNAMGDIEGAVGVYEQVSTLKPNDPRPHYLRGGMLSELRRFKDAADAYVQVLRLQPRHTGALQLLSTALFEQGRAREALACIRRATWLNPTTSGLHTLGVLVDGASHQHPSTCPCGASGQGEAEVAAGGAEVLGDAAANAGNAGPGAVIGGVLDPARCFCADEGVYLDAETGVCPPPTPPAPAGPDSDDEGSAKSDDGDASPAPPREDPEEARARYQLATSTDGEALLRAAQERFVSGLNEQRHAAARGDKCDMRLRRLRLGEWADAGNVIVRRAGARKSDRDGVWPGDTYGSRVHVLDAAASAGGDAPGGGDDAGGGDAVAVAAEAAAAAGYALRTREARYTEQQIVVSTLSTVRIGGPQAVLFDDCNVFVGAHDGHTPLELRGVPFFEASTRRQDVDRVAHVLQMQSNNIYHWLVESLPRLVMIIERVLPREANDTHLALPAIEKMPPFVRDSLELLGVIEPEAPFLLGHSIPCVSYDASRTLMVGKLLAVDWRPAELGMTGLTRPPPSASGASGGDGSGHDTSSQDRSGAAHAGAGANATRPCVYAPPRLALRTARRALVRAVARAANTTAATGSGIGGNPHLHAPPAWPYVVWVSRPEGTARSCLNEAAVVAAMREALRPLGVGVVVFGAAKGAGRRASEPRRRDEYDGSGGDTGTGVGAGDGGERDESRDGEPHVVWMRGVRLVDAVRLFASKRNMGMAAMHGAGLTNALLCRPGTPVVEVTMPHITSVGDADGWTGAGGVDGAAVQPRQHDWWRSDVYRHLCAAMGHPYWPVHGAAAPNAFLRPLALSAEATARLAATVATAARARLAEAPPPPAVDSVDGGGREATQQQRG